MQSQVYLLKFEHCVTLGESRHDPMVNNLLLLSAYLKEEATQGTFYRELTILETEKMIEQKTASMKGMRCSS